MEARNLGRLLLLLSCLAVTRIQAQEILEGPSDTTALPGQTVEFVCNVTGGSPLWRINGSSYTLNQLFTGIVPPGTPSLMGHNSSGTNVVVTELSNTTTYQCFITQTPPLRDIESTSATLLVAGVPDSPSVSATAIEDNDDSLNFTLTWTEPFDNLDPIVNYTVSCVGDMATCPGDTTVNSSITSLDFVNLLPSMEYNISVVATNRVGSGEAGVLNVVVPGQVNITSFSCAPFSTINRCTVVWMAVTMGAPILRYEVYYNGSMMDVTSGTTATFDVAQPDMTLTDLVFVRVTAVNKFVPGPASEPANATIIASQIDTPPTIMRITNDGVAATYDYRITCVFSSVNEIDECRAVASTTGQLDITVDDTIDGGMTATVDFTSTNALLCGRTYTITVGGVSSGVLVEPLSTMTDTVTTGACPVPTTSTVSPSATPTAAPPGDGDDSSNTGAIVGGVVGGIIAFIVLVLIILLIVYLCARSRDSSDSESGQKVKFKNADSSRPQSTRVQTLDRYGKPIADDPDTGVELTKYDSAAQSTSPEPITITQIPPSSGSLSKPPQEQRTASSYMPEGSYDTLAPSEQPQGNAAGAASTEPQPNGQEQKPKLNYADLENFRKPTSVKMPDHQPQSQYAVIDPRSLRTNTDT